MTKVNPLTVHEPSVKYQYLVTLVGNEKEYWKMNVFFGKQKKPNRNRLV